MEIAGRYRFGFGNGYGYGFATRHQAAALREACNFHVFPRTRIFLSSLLESAS
jgi:hypothetical protein